MPTPTVKLLWHIPGTPGWPADISWDGQTIRVCEGLLNIAKFKWHAFAGFGTLTPNELTGWSYEYANGGAGAHGTRLLLCFFVYPKRFKLVCTFDATLVAGPDPDDQCYIGATLYAGTGTYYYYAQERQNTGRVTYDQLSTKVWPACFPIWLQGIAEGGDFYGGSHGSCTLTISIVEEVEP